MANGHGGYRAPSDRAPKVSGVGRNSRRTDTQPVRVPNVGDATDLSHGDRQRLEARLRAQPLSRTPAPDVGGPATPGSSPATPPGRGVLPPSILGLPSSRPDEPITEGLPFGPGAGPEVLSPPDPTDEIDVVLQAMVQMTGDQSIADMLDEHRSFKEWRSSQQTAPVGPPPRVTPEPEMEAPPTEPTMDQDLEEAPLEPAEPSPIEQVAATEVPPEEVEEGGESPSLNSPTSVEG